jgi:hypothetical protein
MRAVNRWSLALVTALALACSGGGEEPKSAISDEEIKKAVSVAKAIRKNPSGADAALADAGLSREQLESLLWKIALDEAASETYAKALSRKAAGAEAPSAGATPSP